MNWVARTLTSSASRAVAARGASILGSFILTILVARQLGVDGAGSFFVAYTSIAILATFGRFGTDNLALKICGGASATIRRDLGYSALIALAASALGIVAVFVVLLTTGYRLPGFDNGWLFLVLLTALPQALMVIAGAVLRGRGRLVLGILAELGSIHFFSILLLVVFELTGGLTVTTALIALAGGSWLTALWSVPAAIASLDAHTAADGEHWWPGFGRFLRQRLRQLSSMMGTSLLFQVLTWAPLYALTITSTLANVSYFTAAARLTNIVSLVPSLQVVYLAPAFARLYHAGQVDELNAMAARAVRQVAVLLLLPVAVLALAGLPVVTLLYGAEFAPAAGPLAVLAVGALLVAIAGQVNQLMLLCDLETHALTLNVALVLAWVTGGIWVAGAFGALGVATFSVAVSIVYVIVAAALLRSRRGIRSYLRVGRP